MEMFQGILLPTREELDKRLAAAAEKTGIAEHSFRDNAVSLLERVMEHHPEVKSDSPDFELWVRWALTLWTEHAEEIARSTKSETK